MGWDVRLGDCLRVLKPGGHLLAFGGTRTWHRLAVAVEDAGFEIRDSIAWLYGSGFPKSLNLVDESGERTGWGTALKPAFEPVLMARKPLAGTVFRNVCKHGTGALNIDRCRIETKELKPYSPGVHRSSPSSYNDDGWKGREQVRPAPSGRWPANVILDESQSATLDSQGARHSRFFYVAKAPTRERPKVDGLTHPTVKPLALMRWLARLVTPDGGMVLDPFAGSGTTVEACITEGFDCIAIEREADYIPLIQARIARALAA